MSNSNCKQSLYFQGSLLEEIKAEAKRTDRSVSWIVNRSWRIARDKIREIPGTDPEPETERSPE